MGLVAGLQLLQLTALLLRNLPLVQLLYLLTELL
jgi:hypothetical protein